jgi:hypothetical protein
VLLLLTGALALQEQPIFPAFAATKVRKYWLDVGGLTGLSSTVRIKGLRGIVSTEITTRSL